MMRKILLLATAIALSMPALADDISTIVVRGPNLTVLRRLIQQAKVAMENGDISAARLYLTPPAKIDIPEALRLMGQTYDPRWLMMHGATSVVFDEVKASQFYIAAKMLGDKEAADILGAVDRADAIKEAKQ